MSFFSLRPSKVHDGTALSFVDAMVKLGDSPDIKSVNAILSSFCELTSQEQDTVMRSPRYWDALAKWRTEEYREDMCRVKIETLKKHLEDVIEAPDTDKAAKEDAARLLAALPKEGKVFDWSRAIACEEDLGKAGKADKEGSK